MTERPILLVEDNEDDEALILLALRRNHISNEVIVARDGPEALGYLLPSDGPDVLPQLVLLDLNLPRLDGVEVLRRLRAAERTRLLPVVILTSSKEDEDIARSYTFGANAYVRKPIEFSELLNAVKAVGLFWIVLNQLPVPPGESF